MTSLLPLPKKVVPLQTMTSLRQPQQQKRTLRNKIRAAFVDSDSQSEAEEDNDVRSKPSRASPVRAPATEKEQRERRLLLSSLQTFSRLSDSFSLCDASFGVASSRDDVMRARVASRDCSVSPGFADESVVDSATHARESRLSCVQLDCAVRCLSTSQATRDFDRIRTELSGLPPPAATTATVSSQEQGVASAEMRSALDLLTLPVEEADDVIRTQELSQVQARFVLLSQQLSCVTSNLDILFSLDWQTLTSQLWTTLMTSSILVRDVTSRRRVSACVRLAGARW